MKKSTTDKASKKANTKVLMQSKRRRRRLITFLRMLRYGVNNFSRNAWLTLAATAVMTITLLIIFTTFVARQVLSDTVTALRDKVDMSIYLKNATTEAEVDQVVSGLNALSSVRTVEVESPEQARAEYIEKHKSSASDLNSLNNSDPKFLWTLRVKVDDINDTSQLQQFVEDNKTYQTVRDSRDPSFAGPYRTAIERVGGWANFAEKAGLTAGVIFVAISSLIIFNTIRMAIFNRREEIYMMKLIGAERSFIRGPFIVEAVMYGFIAAIIATSLGIGAIFLIQDTLEANGVMISALANQLLIYSPIVLLIMILIGSLIGIFSSLVATRRYLKF